MERRNRRNHDSKEDDARKRTVKLSAPSARNGTTLSILDEQQTPSQRPLPLLEFKDVNTYYGELHVLKGVNYCVGEGEIVCLLGGNASGKSTTMKAILGIVTPKSGAVTYAGARINALPTAERVKRGIAPVPEARRLFPRMTVLENLEMGAFTRRDAIEIEVDKERVFGLFPRIRDRLK
ncbi:ABC-type branched-subunit amino acid transport system ATPase component [Bradyrhizobium sp. LB11.1]